jgi:uncharacterized protein YbjT (DUF2867 family)
MRCLVTGAYGFIGQEVARALKRDGWTVIGAGRDLALGSRLLPDIEWIACDFNRDTDAAIWAPRLAGIDAVVNCVGVLQSSFRDDADKIHARSTIALFEACAAAGVKRLVHISAVSAEADMATSYARSKAEADAALLGLDGNWLIVKPSLVIGRGSYGGTSLLRGLAGFPGLLPLPGHATERFQPIALDDLARGIAQLASREQPARTILYAAGPDRLSVRDIVLGYRAWLGFLEAREIVLPLPLLKLLLRLGDGAGLLGYPTSLRSTSLAQMRHDVPVDGSGFASACGGTPKGFRETLHAWPATLQDRLHARAFFVVPLLHVTLALFWIMTGLVTLVPRSFEAAISLVTAAGFDRTLAVILVGSAAIADIVAGALFLLPRFVRRAGVAQLLLSAFYLLGLSLIAPGLWTDNFGPLLKVLPMMAATAVVMAAQENR